MTGAVREHPAVFRRSLGRVGLAAAVALASATAIALLLASSPVARAGGEATLPPDLITLAIADEDLEMKREKGDTVLRFSTEVGNRGVGPLEVFPTAESANCDGDGDPANDRDANQRLFADSDGDGIYSPGIDAVDSERRFGCMAYHPAHDHWHTLDFASYELRREPGGKLVASRRKVGFCVVDHHLAFQMPGSPLQPTYPIGGPPEGNCDAATIQGLSVGWADLYALDLPGQQLVVGGLRRGRYCLSARADPSNLLAEADEANNVRRVRLALRPRRLSVRKLDGGCRGSEVVPPAPGR